MLSVGWIIWNPLTGKKGKTGGYGKHNSKVYSSEAKAKAYCHGDFVPKEVFISKEDQLPLPLN
jgi:hypothetical protein